MMLMGLMVVVSVICHMVLEQRSCKGSLIMKRQLLHDDHTNTRLIRTYKNSNMCRHKSSECIISNPSTPLRAPPAPP